MPKKMSTVVTVSLVGAAAAATAAAIIIANKDDEPKLYGSQEACMSDGRSAAECKAGWDAAVKYHSENAPRYGTLKECEAVFGKCTDGTEQPQAVTTTPSSTPSTSSTTTSHGGGSFWPYYIGYYMGQNSNSSHHYNSVPAYAGRNSAPVTSSGRPFTQATNNNSGQTHSATTQTARQAPAATPSHTTTSQRGGFGSTPAPSGAGG